MSNYKESRPVCVCDTECYRDYWSIGFKSVTDQRRKVFELYEGCQLDRKEIASIFRRWCVVTFNGINYDLPMILLAMSGATNAELKDGSDALIKFGVPYWTFMDRNNLVMPDFVDHIDLMQVSPGAPTQPSLKIYAGRLHSRKMQELPIGIEEHVGEFERQIIRAYHGNDLEVTEDLYKELKTQVGLRTLMSKQYGVDLRSKSDAQVAEAVFKVEIERITGDKVYKPDIEPGEFKFSVPAYVRFETPEMRCALDVVRAASFRVNVHGDIDAQQEVKKLNVRIGRSAYQMGLGGLHSQEARISHRSNDEFVLIDRDVTSYYPQSILLQGMYPKHLGRLFLKIYQRIYERRIAAKRAGDKNTAETLKILLNGVFGKTGSPFSIFFAPSMMIQVTLTGQLAILMLIERLEQAGIEVVSGNTDGIVSKVRRSSRDLFNAIFFDWECDTGYTTEETEYVSLHSQSVNSYIAIKRKKDGSFEAKRKGTLFTQSGPGLDGASGMKKNPTMEICVDAVIAYLTKGEPIEDTIEWCSDVRKFLSVTRVNGGAEKDGIRVGKALRWYHSKEVTGSLHRVDSGNTVPKTDGAKLMLDLLPYVPSDIDHAYYIREAYALLEDLGVGSNDPRLQGRAGRFMARLPDAKNIHSVDARTGIAVCGKTRDSIRDSWVEVDGVPQGHRMCGSCKRGGDL